ncbi:MAG: hypothetical protein A3E07_02095 [Candidatus Wildermuthbacteria bacterium RIFCSPHIGHO2_12_FULL_45_9]|uniref:Ribonuclease H1 N-terminal domain-containing protein n=1 Tax=Candidatus Wildermuthbacteria bacterium RIFCSPHIGHO2_02_FULL_45_25 TaxID=1802450 RepID=A0A1G2R4P1_9BACT|nr:MAG: hypothetical protein A2748_00585 [Candidatus Wildermuthbacteria bacterium RIFCSPHIGHO2_01_FULL_45_20]OHA67697.1 MAG: hypothetical protein A3C04_02045 [Candidatus Wildermuthbacteria bacterium RIFCSPHIGHO2_02_FULL_45_25]OHA70992.1 MAG: hypothetical protein A3E07_02095 [Candidatus Wildermuthbacteria bacterium RIFCSPHIGHO2_12_FULL_45_9]
MAKGKPKYYAYIVPFNHVQGIALEWEECGEKVKGVAGARFKSFSSRKEAEEWLKAGADYGFKKELPKGIYFDAGTGRGDGVEVSVTDEKGTDLLSLAVHAKDINKFGKQTIKNATNNYGELLGCKYAMEIAIQKRLQEVSGDSKLILDYWSKGFIKKDEVAPETVKLAWEVARIRREFEKNGGKLKHISGNENPADLGFHRRAV